MRLTINFIHISLKYVTVLDKPQGPEFLKALEEMKKMGHTSGADTLVGILVGIKASVFSKKEKVIVIKELLKSSNWISGLQWLFFIFTNIVVIPITVGAAFELSTGTIVNMLQLSFIVTGLACIIQAFLGHKRAIMEGQSGLWWGVILTLVRRLLRKGCLYLYWGAA